jgi:hypothetical protein
MGMKEKAPLGVFREELAGRMDIGRPGWRERHHLRHLTHMPACLSSMPFLKVFGSRNEMDQHPQTNRIPEQA